MQRHTEPLYPHLHVVFLLCRYILGFLPPFFLLMAYQRTKSRKLIVLAQEVSMVCQCAKECEKGIAARVVGRFLDGIKRSYFPPVGSVAGFSTPERFFDHLVWFCSRRLILSSKPADGVKDGSWRCLRRSEFKRSRNGHGKNLPYSEKGGNDRTVER